MDSYHTKPAIGYFVHDHVECNYYQAQYGGGAHSIQKIEDVSEIFVRIPFGLDDGCVALGPVISVMFEHRGGPRFVLAPKAERRLRSGFRYMRELLKQAHNLKLISAYDVLGPDRGCGPPGPRHCRPTPRSPSFRPRFCPGL